VEATEWFGTMLGGPYSAQMRDQAPLIETEDFRDEGARRFWDDYSPPYFGFKQGPNDTWHWNSETFALQQVGRYCRSGPAAFPTPILRGPSGQPTPPSISTIPTRTAGRIPARSCRVSGKIDARAPAPMEIYLPSA